MFNNTLGYELYSCGFNYDCLSFVVYMNFTITHVLILLGYALLAIFLHPLVCVMFDLVKHYIFSCWLLKLTRLDRNYRGIVSEK